MGLITEERSVHLMRIGTYIGIAVLFALAGLFIFARAESGPGAHQGLQPFTPTRIDWLTTTLQASLRDEELETNGYTLQITSPDSETILIYVRYLPTVNRQVMNTSVDAARQVIQTTAKGYGWQKWVKIREDVQLAK